MPMTRPALAAMGALVAAIAIAGCSPTAGVASPSPSAPAASPLAAPTSGPIDCGPGLAAPGALVLLSDQDFRIGGWSHVTSVGSFSTVRHDVGTYRISAENYVADPTCDGARTFAAVLAKKTYDWDRQHANGIETTFAGEGLTFGHVSGIALVVRVDPSLTTLPSAEEYAQAYGDVMTPAELAAFDQGQVNLELTLFGAGATADDPFVNAGAIIAVDPSQAADGWVRVQLTRDDLTFYTEDNYERTVVGADDYPDLLVQGLRINPETASGKVARHYLGDDFDPAARPELFKEMGLRFALIEVDRS